MAPAQKTDEADPSTTDDLRDHPTGHLSTGRLETPGGLLTQAMARGLSHATTPNPGRPWTRSGPAPPGHPAQFTQLVAATWASRTCCETRPRSLTA